MYANDKIYVGLAGEKPIVLLPDMANRHGLIAGATGTGKTITLKVLAEAFSDMGTPVFLADVKGDLAGMCKPGVDTEDMQKRIERFGLKDTSFEYQSFPVTFWDLYQKKGLPLRTTISEMGPTLLARLMGLSDLQEDILTIVFQIADNEELPLDDTKDLKATLNHVAENLDSYAQDYGHMAKASINVIIREVAALDSLGCDFFFGRPALDIDDWLMQGEDGKGMIHILDSSSLINQPQLYAIFMLWLLSELFETMPEVGDLEQPKMVFFFDEAHLLFKDAPKALLQKIEQVVKLIRSKGIGVYFITQNPADIPDAVLAQLGNKIQHALHAYTPAEQKGIKAAAASYRPNPAFKTADAIQELGIGEALVSMLQEDGTPSVVERVKILPPESQMGPITDEERAAVIENCQLREKYDTYVDEYTAYEILQEKAEQEEQERLAHEEAVAAEKLAEKERIAAEKQARREQQAYERQLERDRMAAIKAEEKERLAYEKQLERERNAAQKAWEREQLARERDLEADRRRRQKAAERNGSKVGRQLGRDIGGAIGGRYGRRIGGDIGAGIGRGMMGNFGRRY